MTQVTRAKEWLALQGDEGLGCGVWPLPVALEHLGAVHDDFTLLADRHFCQGLGVNHARIGAHERDAQALLLGVIGRVAVRGRGSFGQAVTFDITQAVLLQQPLRHSLRHGGATAANVDQGGEVKACKIGAGQQINHHGGNVGPVRDLPARDQAASQFAVPAWHQNQSGCAANAGVHHAHHACDVEHGHHGQHHVFSRSVAPQAAGHGVVHDAGMPVHTPLGKPRGAAGIGQDGQICGSHAQFRHRQGVAQGLVPAMHLPALQSRHRVRGQQPVCPGGGRGVVTGNLGIKGIGELGDH